MNLVFHGGLCCGIKTIYGFHSKPDSKIFAPKLSVNPVNNDQHGAGVNSDLSFFTDDAPAETLAERLDRLIAFCRKHRPQGIIEATLSSMVIDYSWEDDNDYDEDESSAPDWARQDGIWGPELEKRGFKMVTRAMNSNSGNYVSIYHLVYGEGND